VRRTGGGGGERLTPAQRPPGTGPTGALTRTVGWILPRESVDRVVYGVILVGALLAAEDGTYESYLDTILSAVIAAAIYWLAHSYAELLARRLTSQDRLTVGVLARSLVKEAALLIGAAIPILVLVIGWATGASQSSAVNAALWSAVASLIVFELVAAQRAPATLPERVLELCVGVTIGLGILVLKIVLH
jgi:hypothetical protein